METQTRPNLSRIATWLAGVLMTVGSLVWSGAMMAAERPTFAQTKEIATNTRAEQAHEATQKHLEEQKAEMQRHQEVLTTLSLQMQMVLKGITNIEEKMERQRR